jgi:hypothetical protein
MYFAGLNGNNIITMMDGQWTILQINSQTKEQQIIGFIQTNEYSRKDLTIIGLNLMRCNGSTKNEAVSLLLKFTNVSKENEIYLTL